MIRTALVSVAAVLSLVLTLAVCAGAGQTPTAQPPLCSSRDTLDDLLARSAGAYVARDGAQGLKLLRQAFDLGTANGCVLERAEALRRLALADDFGLKYDEAREKLDEAAAVFRRFGVTLGEAQSLTQIGSAFIGSSQFGWSSASQGTPMSRITLLSRDADLADHVAGDQELCCSGNEVVS